MKNQAKEKKPWTLTQTDIDSITNVEKVMGTTRLLPPMEEIPREFFEGNIYTRIAEEIYVGDPPPKGEVNFLPGFREDGKAMMRCLMAHISSCQPSYEHKIAGVGYMISKIMRITVILT